MHIRKYELKRRNADPMEVDTETMLSKKARMEVEDEVHRKEREDENKNSDIVSAGLLGQPGGAQ